MKAIAIGGALYQVDSEVAARIEHLQSRIAELEDFLSACNQAYSFARDDIDEFRELVSKLETENIGLSDDNSRLREALGECKLFVSQMEGRAGEAACDDMHEVIDTALRGEGEE